MNIKTFSAGYTHYISNPTVILQGETLTYQLIPTISWLKLTRWEMNKGIHILTMTISHQRSDATWNRSRRLTCRRWPKLPTSRTGTATRTWQTSASTTTSPKLALANVTKTAVLRTDNCMLGLSSFIIPSHVVGPFQTTRYFGFSTYITLLLHLVFRYILCLDT